MRLGGCALSLALSLLFLSCAPKASKPDKSDDKIASKKQPVRLSDEETRRVIERVSGARAVAVQRDVKVEWLTPEAFRERLRAPSSQGRAQDEALLVGLDFLPPPKQRNVLAPVQEVVVEQVAAFYDLKADTVFVPEKAMASKEDRFLQRAILAHEVHHALQAQNFGLKEPSHASSDEELSNLALIEGDAMVAMAAFIGAEAGAPVGRTLRRLREITEGVPREKIGHRLERSALERAPALLQRVLRFPYEEGMFFVSDVFRTGGFDLVNAMYARPPRTTEHILHPEKYLQDEQPRAIGQLVAPTNIEVTRSDVLGELQTSVLLERCATRETAQQASAGWNGDKVFALSSSSEMGVAWVSAWDTPEDAREVESVLQSNKCFSQNEANGKTLSGSIVVERRGNVVALVRGFEPPAQKALLSTLLQLPKDAPKAQPLTQLRMPPRVPLQEPRQGTLEFYEYRNDWLGLVGRVPEGMLGRLDVDGLDLLVERKGTAIAGALSLSTRVTSDELNDATLDDVGRTFLRTFKGSGAALVQTGTGPVKTELGNGVDRTWKLQGTKIKLRALLVPICAGTGSLVFVEAYADAHAKAVLDGWIGSFRFPKGRNLPACDYLDPK